MGNEVELLDTNNENKVKKVPRGVIAVFTLLAFGLNIYLIYNILLFDGIEDLIRYIAVGIFAIIDILILVKSKKIMKNKDHKKKKKKPSKRIGFLIFLIIYAIISFGLAYVLNYVYGQLNSVNKKTVTYTSSLVVLSENEAKTIKDVKDYKIGILQDKKSPEGYIIPQEIIKENKLHDNNDIVEYDSYTEMIADLYTKDVDAIFLSSEYASMYNSISGYENIATETKKIISKSKKMLKSKVSKEENASSGKSVSEPFTILLMGVDSTDEVLTKNTVANGDSLILITFNPKTLNATMISIPRDSYVPIACWPGKKENKITHAAAYGTDCMINTIENFFDVDIDYYAKINFKGLVKLVDAMGGIDVEVPQELCTDNSNREVEVCIKEGWQHLDGEGALVLSRNRKQLVNGDFGRGQNQQLVIQAMLQKVKTINSISQFTKIFNSISNSLDTNLTTKQILSFYSVAKDIVKTGLSSDNSNIVSIDQLYLQGQSAMIYDNSMRMLLYNYVPNTYSKSDITKAMKANLELIEHKETKKFSFSINTPYEKTITGMGPYKSTFDASKYKTTLPDDDKKTNCGANEELGADKKTCVCKYGFEKVNGKCTEKDAKEETITCTGANEELGADKKTCVCKYGFEKINGKCTEKQAEKEETTTPANNNNTSNGSISENGAGNQSPGSNQGNGVDAVPTE